MSEWRRFVRAVAKSAYPDGRPLRRGGTGGNMSPSASLDAENIISLVSVSDWLNRKQAPLKGTLGLPAQKCDRYFHGIVAAKQSVRAKCQFYWGVFCSRVHFRKVGTVFLKKEHDKQIFRVCFRFDQKQPLGKMWHENQAL
jgi:hypothetical protein